MMNCHICKLMSFGGVNTDEVKVSHLTKAFMWDMQN